VYCKILLTKWWPNSACVEKLPTIICVPKAIAWHLRKCIKNAGIRKGFFVPCSFAAGYFSSGNIKQINIVNNYKIKTNCNGYVYSLLVLLNIPALREAYTGNLEWWAVHVITFPSLLVPMEALL